MDNRPHPTHLSAVLNSPESVLSLSSLVVLHSQSQLRLSCSFSIGFSYHFCFAIAHDCLRFVSDSIITLKDCPRVRLLNLSFSRFCCSSRLISLPSKTYPPSDVKAKDLRYR